MLIFHIDGTKTYGIMIFILESEFLNKK